MEMVQLLSNYENHYNRRLNKCFILEASSSFRKDAKGKSIKMLFLVDANENKICGTFGAREKSGVR